MPLLVYEHIASHKSAVSQISTSFLNVAVKGEIICEAIVPQRL